MQRALLKSFFRALGIQVLKLLPCLQKEEMTKFSTNPLLLCMAGVNEAVSILL